MKRKRKNFLGCIGLVLVVAMTIVAYSIPSPDVNAEAANTDSVTIMVTVNNGQEPAVHINTPYDGFRIVKNQIDLEISYSNATNIAGTITNIETGSSVSFGKIMASPESDTYIINDFDFATAGEYNNYNISVSVGNPYGFSEDSISFFYQPIIAEITGHAKNNDPILTLIDKNDEVSFVTIQAYKQPGDDAPLFSSALQYDANDILNKNITLPFADNNTKEGTYIVEVLGYTSNEEGSIDEQIGLPVRIPIEYIPPEVPETPDTGAFFTSLNITEADYLITGLIVFFIISISLIVFMKKSSRR